MREFFMKTLKTLAIALFALVGVTTAANAASTFLATDDIVGISFWLISMGMLAATGIVMSILGTFFVKVKEGGSPHKALNLGSSCTSHLP
jgi:K(+)-stimulated pyrophosphate-energized sodium pump